MNNSRKIRYLKKGIATAFNRINKGLKGKKLVYALRYIKGAKTQIKNLIAKNRVEGANKKEVSKIEILETPKNKIEKSEFNEINKNASFEGVKTYVLKAVKDLTNRAKTRILKSLNNLKNRIQERKKEIDFLKRWEDLEEGDRGNDGND